MDRRQSHTPRIGKAFPERRKNVFERRRHTSVLRIFFIPWRRLFGEFSDVQLF
nr:hypothetical protein [uncultured Holophaga sp.]